jgi:anti-sigma B factor antagonist
MPFEVDRSTLDSGVIVLSLSGSMTMGNQLQKLEWTVEELIKNQQNRIVLDMSKITYLDSSAVGVLVGCHGLAKNAGGQLRVAGTTERVGTIFKMSGVDAILSLDATRSDSESAFGASA